MDLCDKAVQYESRNGVGQTTVIYDEETALSAVETLAKQTGLQIVTSDIERSDLLDTMPIVNLFVIMDNPGRTFASMNDLSRSIDRNLGGKCRVGLYYAAIGYDEVPEGQGHIQIDILPFELSSASRVIGGLPPARQHPVTSCRA